jgi:DNA-binding MarR family transcriptional regulator
MASMRLARRLRQQRAGHGLGFGQLSVLATLDRHGAMTAGELAGHEQVRPPSMTRTLGCLHAAGYVTRTASASDRRQVVVDITPSARELLREDRRRRDEWLSARLRALEPDQLAALTAAVPVLEVLASS